MQACQRTCRRILKPPQSASIDRPEAQLGCRNMCSFRSQAESRLRQCYCFLERSNLALVGFHCETELCQSDTLPLSYHHQLLQIISITAPLRTAATHIFGANSEVVIVGEISLEKEMATCSSILTWKIPWTEETRAGYSPWGHKESDMTERLSTHTHTHTHTHTLNTHTLNTHIPQTSVLQFSHV